MYQWSPWIRGRRFGNHCTTGICVNRDGHSAFLSGKTRFLPGARRSLGHAMIVAVTTRTPQIAALLTVQKRSGILLPSSDTVRLFICNFNIWPTYRTYIGYPNATTSFLQNGLNLT